MTYSIALVHPSKELHVIVDDCDIQYVQQYTWYAFEGRRTYYAHRHVYNSDGNRTMSLLHRELLSANDAQKVDHKDRNGLNCVRGNLRIATRAQNAHNTVYKVGKSGYRGVYAMGNRFVARITTDGFQMYIGIYGSAKEAAKAYDKEALEIYQDFAFLNFPSGSEDV